MNAAAPVQAQPTRRQQLLQASLQKKEAAFNQRLQNHFDTVAEANGQPMNDKRGGAAWFTKLDKQNDALRTLDKSIEKTKAALAREQDKIERVAAQSLPPAIAALLADGTLTQWRKFPNRFFVAGVEKGRIVWDEKQGGIFALHHREIPNQAQYATFRDVFNALRAQLAA